MNRILLKIIIVMSIFVTTTMRGQVTPGSISPDWTLTDINGNSHHLYSYLNSGKTVFLDISATWCGPCWQYHQSGAFEDLWVNHGPIGSPGVSNNSTNDCMVFFVEGDATTTLADLNGTGPNTQGDWVTGTSHPIIDPTASTNPTTNQFLNMYSLAYFPSCIMICPDGSMKEVDQYTAAQLYSAKLSTCSSTSPPPPDAGVASILSPGGLVGCNTTVSPSVEVKNFGSTVLTSCTIQYQIDNGPIQTYSWTGSLASGQSITVALPASIVSLGPHTFTSNTTNPNGTIDSNSSNDQSLVSFTINSVTAPTVTDGQSCNSPASVTLGATGSGTLNWYTTPTGGSAVGTGGSYVTPSLNATTIYYVEDQIPGTTGNVGPATTTIFGGGGYHNNSSTQYLIFNVIQSCTLNTAIVNSGASGTRNILVWDTTGTLLQTVPVNFPSGSGTVTLNIHFTPGSYRIGGTGMNLWRNNTGGTYPFSLAGVIDITGSSAGPNYYYYLYNWEIETDPCISARVPVNAVIGGIAVNLTSSGADTMSVNDYAVLLTGTPVGGTFSGTGVSSSGVFDPSIAGSGSHPITYSYSDSSGCSGTKTITIFVISGAGIASQQQLKGVNIFPNPSDGLFTIEMETMKGSVLDVSIINSMGQLMRSEKMALYSGKNKLDFNFETWPKGIYYVQLKAATDIVSKRIIIR